MTKITKEDKVMGTQVVASTSSAQNEVNSSLSFGAALAGKYMTFKLALEEYGVEILKVREIIGLMDITSVPKTDKFVSGVINLRGKVIPVIDLRLKFGMDKIEATDTTVIIVVQINHKDQELTIGIMVDEVLEVLDVKADQIEPPPSFGGATVDTDYILGVGKEENRVIFLLDIDKVLTVEEVDKVSKQPQ